MESFLQELRSRIPLSSIVAKKVSLRPQGREKIGRCPFHEERTPSFTVNDAKGVYYCFGCGEKGDIVTFLRKTSGYSFKEAAESLAKSIGLSLPSLFQEPGNSLSSLQPVLQEVWLFWHQLLHSDQGLAAQRYLKLRGFPLKTAMQLGWAWAGEENALYRHLASKGFQKEALLKAGIVHKSSYGKERLFFQKRILFPIRNIQGHILGFGGRTLEEARGPKYLNSPDSMLFHKSQALYGLYESQLLKSDAAKSALPFYVVEGYFDVGAILATGKARAASPLGTALSHHHITQLWHLCPQPVVCFDGDNAGRRASYQVALKALEILKPDHTLLFASLPAGEDPASFILHEGAEKFFSLMQQCRPLVEYLWSLLQEEFQRLTLPEQRAGLYEKLKTWIATIIHPEVKAFYRSAWTSRWNVLCKQNFVKKPTSSLVIPRTIIFNPAIRGAEVLLAAILNHPQLLEIHLENIASLVLPSFLIPLQNCLLAWCAMDPKTHTLNAYLKHENLAFLQEKICTEAVYMHGAFARPSSNLSLEVLERKWQECYDAYLRLTLRKELSHYASDAILHDEEAWERLQALMYTFTQDA